jgi:hypothetical protein
LKAITVPGVIATNESPAEPQGNSSFDLQVGNGKSEVI